MKKPVNHRSVKPGIFLTGAIEAAELVGAGPEGQRMSAHKIWMPPHSEYPLHEHPSPHIILVLEGGGYVQCRSGGSDIRYAIEAGDVFHVLENVPHQVGADAKGMIMIAVSVDSLPLDNPERLKVLQE